MIRISLWVFLEGLTETTFPNLNKARGGIEGGREAKEVRRPLTLDLFVASSERIALVGLGDRSFARLPALLRRRFWFTRTHTRTHTRLFFGKHSLPRALVSARLCLMWDWKEICVVAARPGREKGFWSVGLSLPWKTNFNLVSRSVAHSLELVSAFFDQREGLCWNIRGEE